MRPATNPAFPQIAHCPAALQGGSPAARQPCPLAPCALTAKLALASAAPVRSCCSRHSSAPRRRCASTTAARASGSSSASAAASSSSSSCATCRQWHCRVTASVPGHHACLCACAWMHGHACAVWECGSVARGQGLSCDMNQACDMKKACNMKQACTCTTHMARERALPRAARTSRPPQPTANTPWHHHPPAWPQPAICL